MSCAGRPAGRRSRALVLILAGALTFLTAAAGGAVAGVAPRPDGLPDPVVTYDVATRGSVTTELGGFGVDVASTLRDPRGWALDGAVSFRRVEQDAQLHVLLAAPSDIAREPDCSAQYSCRIGPYVLVNDDRWNDPGPGWTGSLAQYRSYLLNHEIGHYLGLGHTGCPGTGLAAPVMLQQSKSLQGCTAAVWPSDAERAEVGRRFGVTPDPVLDRTSVLDPRQPDRVAVTRPSRQTLRWLTPQPAGSSPARSGTTLQDSGWGRPSAGDVAVLGDWDGDGVDTPGVARPEAGLWVWLLSDSPMGSPGAARVDHELRWGRPGLDDVPVVGDWDGDGRDTPAAVRIDGDALHWLVTDRLEAPVLSARPVWGRAGPGDQPVPGDWDGDGRDDPGVVRTDADGLHWLLPASARGPARVLTFGGASDTAVAGDWNGDGADSPGAVRARDRILHWTLSADPAPAATALLPGRRLTWGRTGDLPLAGRR